MVPKITNDGLGLQVLALDGEGLNFSKIVMGNGEAPLDYRVLKDLVNPLEELNIDDLDIEDTEAVITATFSNANTDDSFDWTEVGIFCTNPASTQQEPLDDILYAYGHCRLDDENIDDAAHIPAHGSEVFEILLKYRIFIGDLDDVTATIIDSQNYATKLELNQHTAESNPHNTSASDVGLGNVENVAFLDREVDWRGESLGFGNISIGMKMSTFFSKVYMAISNLIEHLTDHVVHINSSERTAWNNKSDKGHKHSASDINSGTLSIARGGTGQSTPQNARTALGLNELYKTRFPQRTITLTAGEEKFGSINLEKIAGYTPMAIADWQLISDNDYPHSSEIELKGLRFSYSNQADYCGYILKNHYNGSNRCTLDIGVLYLRNT